MKPAEKKNSELKLSVYKRHSLCHSVYSTYEKRYCSNSKNLQITDSEKKVTCWTHNNSDVVYIL